MAADPQNYRLDRCITIQQRSVSRDASNGQVAAWNDLATVSANRADQKGTRYDSNYAGSQVNSILRTFFTIRWRSDLAALDGVNQVIVHEGRRFKLCGQPYEVSGRRRYLQFFAEAGEAKL